MTSGPLACPHPYLGVELKSGQIIDATFVPVPIQRNKPENNAIKSDAVPIEWGKTPAKLAQKDIDAKERKTAAGRKVTCRVLMFKLLVLQRLHNLSDERLQYQV
ncbi:MAG: hypothetical protein U1D06_10880, partial [Paracoccaceae bacterium]|nr:hypothetical protein [Paracoccaceae bacterium]